MSAPIILGRDGAIKTIDNLAHLLCAFQNRNLITNALIHKKVLYIDLTLNKHMTIDYIDKEDIKFPPGNNAMVYLDNYDPNTQVKIMISVDYALPDGTIEGSITEFFTCYATKKS